MYSELKVIQVYGSDPEQFEKEVNRWCCNCDYKIISCQASAIGDSNYINVYTAFLGK